MSSSTWRVKFVVSEVMAFEAVAKDMADNMTSLMNHEKFTRFPNVEYSRIEYIYHVDTSTLLGVIHRLDTMDKSLLPVIIIEPSEVGDANVPS